LARATLSVGSGAPSLAFCQLGTAVALGGGAYLSISGALAANSSEALTLSWLEIPASPGLYDTVFSLTSGLQVGRGTAADAYNPLWAGGSSGSGVTTATGVPVISQNVIRRFVIVGRGGATSTTLTDWDIWVDGIKYAFTASGALGASTHNQIGASDGVNTFTGSLTDILYWARALADAEVVDYFRNPYIHYVPVVQRMYFGAGAAPTTHAASVRVIRQAVNRAGTF
jgi:hypothetical protein